MTRTRTAIELVFHRPARGARAMALVLAPLVGATGGAALLDDPAAPTPLAVPTAPAPAGRGVPGEWGFNAMALGGNAPAPVCALPAGETGAGTATTGGAEPAGR